MNKKTIIILITLIIIIGIICGIAFSKNANKNITTNTQKQEENTITNEQTNNVTNELTENEIEENNIPEPKEPTITAPEEPKETPKTEEEKAIEIVKKDMGVSDEIKFEIEGKDSKGRIIVAVRNIQTTEALQFYHVDVSNGTFIKE